MERRPNAELKAGIVIIVALVILCFMIFAMSDITDLWKVRKDLVIHFNKVSGIGEGSTVRYAGLDKGKVASVRQNVVTDPKTGEQKTEVLVFCKLDADVELRQNDKPQVVELITGNQWIDIASYPGLPLEPDKSGPFKGMYELWGEPVTTFGDLMQKAGGILSSIDEMVRGTEGQSLKETITSLRNASATLERIAADVEDLVKENRESITNTIASVDRSATGIEKLIDDNTKPINEAIADARGMLEENRASVKEAVDNLRDLTAELNTLVGDNREKINVTIEDIKDFAGRLETIGENVTKMLAQMDEVLGENRGDVHRAVALLAESAAELRLGLEDIRRSPWKLLYKPKENELALQNIYDSIRAINIAAGGVREVAAALEDADGKRAGDLKRQLAQEINNLAQARARLFEALAKQTKEKK